MPNTVFETQLDVRWGDQDLNGHVNNASAITLVEEARVRAVQSWHGSSPSTRTPRVVKALNTVYHNELNQGFARARVWISRIGHTSYTVCHELIQHNNLCVYSEAVIVVLDPDSRRPTAISSELKDILHQHYKESSNAQ